MALWLGTVVLGAFVMWLLVVHPSVGALVALYLFIVGLLVLVAGDAARLARRSPAPFPLRPYNRWYVYLGVMLTLGFVVQPTLARTIKAELLEAVRIPGISMAPTYLAGDYLFVAPLRRAPKRGDIVVYRTESGSFMTRILGTSGDTIAMTDGRLVINRDTIAEPYASVDLGDPIAPEFSWQREYLVGSARPDQYRPSLHNWGPLRVPEGAYFLLGDNRSNSLDSRFVGFIGRDAIKSRPVMIYWSFDSSWHAIRWSRIGRTPL